MQKCYAFNAVELRHLRYFVAVAEDQNVTRAAARLHLSQPALSRQIQNLEAELGIALFEHRAKSVKLTNAGQVFLEKACALLKQADKAVSAAKAAAKGERGEIHVGYAPSLTVDLLPNALRAFQSESPEVHVQLHDLSTQDMIHGLQKGQLHVAFLVRVSEKILAGFSFHELCRFAVCVALPPNHPLTRMRSVSLEQLAAEPFVAFTHADYPEHHMWLSELFARIERPPRIREEHDSVTSLVASVEAGRGVAMVLEPFKCFAPRVKIRAVSPAPPPLAVGIAAVRGTASPIVKNFIRAAATARVPS